MSPRPTLVPRIAASGGSCSGGGKEQGSAWPTPTTSDGLHGGPLNTNRTGDPKLSRASIWWTETGLTPEELPKINYGKLGSARPTPTRKDGESHSQEYGKGDLRLSGAAEMWPTPASRDWRGANGEDHLAHGTGRKHLDQLPNYVQHVPSGRPDLTTTPGGQPSSSGGRRLNPLFVEWLQGLPVGWTDLRHSGTPSCPPRPPLRSACSGTDYTLTTDADEEEPT